ncbi:MAG: hypothetical protein WCG25_04285 [bacterium]
MVHANISEADADHQFINTITFLFILNGLFIAFKSSVPYLSLIETVVSQVGTKYHSISDTSFNHHHGLFLTSNTYFVQSFNFDIFKSKSLSIQNENIWIAI